MKLYLLWYNYYSIYILIILTLYIKIYNIDLCYMFIYRAGTRGFLDEGVEIVCRTREYFEPTIHCWDSWDRTHRHEQNHRDQTYKSQNWKHPHEQNNKYKITPLKSIYRSNLTVPVLFNLPIGYRLAYTNTKLIVYAAYHINIIL